MGDNESESEVLWDTDHEGHTTLWRVTYNADGTETWVQIDNQGQEIT